MFADALGCPVTVAAGAEFGAKGAALNAGIALGLYTSFADAVAKTVHPGRRYEPDLAKRDAYATSARGVPRHPRRHAAGVAQRSQRL